MKTKIICSVMVLIILISGFPSALALAETQKYIPADLQALIDKAYDPNNDISESDERKYAIGIIIGEKGDFVKFKKDLYNLIATYRTKA